MRVVGTLFITLTLILSLLVAHYKRSYDKAIHTQGVLSERLVEAQKSLGISTSSLDICLYTNKLTSDYVLSLNTKNAHVDDKVEDIINRVEKHNEKNVVDYVSDDVNSLLTEAWDRIYKAD